VSQAYGTITAMTERRAGGRRIYGEDALDLLPIIQHLVLNFEDTDHGTMTTEWSGDATIARPFLRALLRAEAELRLEEADTLEDDDMEHLTPEQRRAKALVRLLEVALQIRPSRAA
jgi:hypothetical protein